MIEEFITDMSVYEYNKITNSFYNKKMLEVVVKAP